MSSPAFPRKPFSSARTPSGRPGFGAKRPYGGSREGSFGARPEGGRPFPGGAGKPWAPRGAGASRPWQDRKPAGAWAPRGGDRPSFGDRKPFSGGKPAGDRPWTPRPPRFGARPEGAAPARGPVYFDGRPAESRSEGGPSRPWQDRKPSFGGRSDRMGAERRPWTPRPEGGQDRPAWQDRKPAGAWAPRGGDRPSFSDRKPFSADRKPSGDRPWTPRPKADGDRPRPKTSWGGVKEWYAQHLQGDDTYHRQVVLPNLLRCIAPKAGEKALDVACGEGFFSRALAESGCDVVGADISTELVAQARKVAPKSGTTPSYVVAPAHELGFVDPESQDLALCVLAIQNIANPHEVFPAIAKALKLGGRLGIVMNHPAFRVPKQSSWGWDPVTRAQFRRVDKYLSESKDRIQMHPGSDPSATTLSYHRPLQYFVKQLAKAGFAVTNLEEWVSHRVSDSGPRAEAENIIRKEIPLFLFLEAKRLS